MLIFICILLSLLGGIFYCVVVGRKSEESLSKLGCWLMTIVLSLLPFAFFLLLSGPVGMIFGFGSYLLIELLFLGIIFRWFRKRAIRIAYFCVILAICIGTGGLYCRGRYVDSLAKVTESHSILWDYKPTNEQNKLAVLDEPATLSLTENIPLLDGATALYPVYAAFANAVYPPAALEWSEDPVQWNDSATLGATTALECSTTTWAYEKLVDGEADIIFVAGPSDAQLQYAADNGEEMVFTPIGRECFVFFVNANNPIDGLTVDQIRSIYSGETTNWKDLGADLGRIRAFQRDEGSGSQSALMRFMGDVPLMEPSMETVSGSMGGIIERVADYRNYKNAIGYSFRFYSTEMVKNGEIKLLEINGVAPTKENILNDAYPISDNFYAVTLKSNDNPNVPLLIDWILSPQGQELIDKTGYVALN